MIGTMPPTPPIASRRSPPTGFWIAAVLLVLWEAVGVWSWWEHWRNGPRAMGATPTDADVRDFAALPAWYVWLYALATWSALAGGLAVLARRAVAVPLFGVSLAATVAMFGYTFLATDLIARKGLAVVVPFPAFIVAVGVAALVFARAARARGWLR
jgi:hypothetical protein